MQKSPDPISQLIDLWPSLDVFAKDLGLLDIGHVRVIKCRRRIPKAYWWPMAAAAKRRKIQGVTVESLKDIHKNIGARPSR